jgi:flagellin-like hook-associated protein FlgL
MESLSLSHSVVNNLNQAFDEHTKINRHLQTGKRVMHASDDVGEASKLGKTKMDLIKNRKIQGNLQNSLSLLQAQDGMFKVIGNILDRSSELKIRFDSPVANSAEKEAYNKEFTELQGELRSIAQSKWNGISLFSTQNSRTLFGAPVDTPDLMQESNESGTDAPLKLSRWGIYHHVPKDETTPLNKKLLAITLTDESEGNPNQSLKPYKGSNASEDPDGLANYLSDKAAWEAFTDGLGIQAEIAVVVSESVFTAEAFAAGDGIDSDGGEVVPASLDEITDLTGFAKVYRGMGREEFSHPSSPAGATPSMQSPADQADFLWAKFQEMTNNGTDLPDALGIFVDNSGSQYFNEVNDALFQFVDRVKATYPSIILPSDNLTSGSGPSAVDLATDPNGEAIDRTEIGIFRGISLAGAEDWINQSQMALQNLIDNDPTFQAALTTDQESPTLALSTYTQAELVGFLDTLTQARGQNAAEQQRIRSEIEELQGRVVGLEQSIEVGEGLDIPMAMGVFHRTKDQVDLNAQLVAAAKDMENVLYTDFL